MTKALHYRAKVDGNFLDPAVLSSQAWISQREGGGAAKLELVLQRRSIVDRIEIIAHSQYMPRRVAIATTDDEVNGSEKELGEVEFQAGYAEHSLLKTVYTDVRCTVIILRIKPPEGETGSNEHRQVGLAGVQIFGRYESAPGPDDAAFGSRTNPTDIPTNGRFSAEIDELLQRVERNKSKVAMEMDFNQAKRAQLETNLLKKARSEMGELEHEQFEAIKDEDFHRALNLQEEMKTLRGNVLASVDPRLTTDVNDSNTTADIHRPKNLFDKEDSKITTPKLFVPIASSNSSHSDRVLKKRPSSVSSKASSSSGSGTKNTPLPKVTELQRNKFLEKENTVVPALQDKRRLPDIAQEESKVLDQEQQLPPLHPSETDNYSKMVELFGLVEYEYSNNVNDKQQHPTTYRLLRISARPFRKDCSLQHLRCIQGGSIHYSTVARWYQRFKALDISLEGPPRSGRPLVVEDDSLCEAFKVYTGALDLLDYVCTKFMVDHSLQKSAPQFVKALHGTIAVRASDTDRRSAGKTLTTMNEILELDRKIAKVFINQYLKSAVRGGLRGQATIIQNATESIGTPNPEVGLTEQSVTQFGLFCLKQSDPEVRSIGKKLVLDVYANGKRNVVFKLVSAEERDHPHPLLRTVLDEIVVLNSSQASYCKIKTYNARTLASEASVEDLVMQARKIKYDVIGLPETRRHHPLHAAYDSGEELFLGTCDSRGVGCVGVLVNTHLAMNKSKIDAVVKYGVPYVYVLI
ncbi:unnamed protein product [Heligmosomoides polygyrus]|uniref:UVR domain-containing protein n=1 Tax=Heligmosomoides polygyrus TaxID=6339 RepID=A0A3P7WLZ2_HELPZ|nr:unnamed protein product [Heligmosomoides polygyrus]